jgi:hypothetical protein
VVWSATAEEKRAAVSSALAVSASVWWSSRETHTKGVADQVIAMIRYPGGCCGGVAVWEEKLWEFAWVAMNSMQRYSERARGTTLAGGSSVMPQESEILIRGTVTRSSKAFRVTHFSSQQPCSR